MTYQNVQALRGVAALLVMLMHLLRYVDAFYSHHGASTGLIGLVAPRSLPLGLIGVDVFFVISGFVLFLSARRAATSRQPVRFAVNRLVRVYPLYWVVFTAAAISSNFVDPTYFMRAFSNWREFFLVDISNYYEVIGPAWTLMYEIYFYFWISLVLLLFPGRLGSALFVWGSIHLMLIVSARMGWIGSLNPVTDAILMDFAAGMAIAYGVSARRLRYARSALLVCAPLLAAGMMFLSTQDQTIQVDRVWRLLTFGLMSICIVYAAIALEQEGRLMPSCLRWLGDISYSLYIWHTVVFWTLNWTGSRLGFYTFEHPYLTALAWGGASIGVAALSYRWIEVPLLSLMKRRADRNGVMSEAAT